jgi:hypothetical protein
LSFRRLPIASSLTRWKCLRISVGVALLVSEKAHMSSTRSRHSVSGFDSRWSIIPSNFRRKAARRPRRDMTSGGVSSSCESILYVKRESTSTFDASSGDPPFFSRREITVAQLWSIKR